MGRPAKNQAEPSASERMEDAFWDLLEEKPFTKITVSDIVKKAAVNRNAFYYHHENIGDLANKAVQDLLAKEGPYMITKIVETNGDYINEILDNPKRSELLKRIRLISSTHSSPILTDMLKQAVINMWFTSFKIDEDKLEPEAHVVITFAIGGFMELLGKWEIGKGDVTPKTLIGSGIVTTVANLIAQTLTPTSYDTNKLNEVIETLETKETRTDS